MNTEAYRNILAADLQRNTSKFFSTDFMIQNTLPSATPKISLGGKKEGLGW